MDLGPRDFLTARVAAVRPLGPSQLRGTHSEELEQFQPAMERVRDRGRPVKWKGGTQAAVHLSYECRARRGPAGVELGESVEAFAVGCDRIAKRDAAHRRPCRVRILVVRCRSA